MLVFEQDLYAGFLHLVMGVRTGGAGNGDAFGQDFEGVAFFQGVIKGGNALSVHHHLPLGEHALDAGPGLLG